jgi:putative oxidoreductase
MTNYHPAQNLALFFGRILFAAIFVISGFNKVFNYDGTVAYMMQAGMDFYVPQLAIVAIVFELGGGLMVLFGWHAKIGASLLLIFVLSVNFAIHHYWDYPAAEAPFQMINFYKNFSILGGTFYIMSFGAGRYSFDGMRRTKFKRPTAPDITNNVKKETPVKEN